MKRLPSLKPGLLGAAALVLAAEAASAQVPITLASSNGNASTQTAAYGITPSGGQTNQFLLTTINPAASLPADGSLGTTSANTNVTTLNTYFGLPNGTLAGQGVQDGSGYLTQQVTLTAGTTVHFDYIFLTDEDNTTAYHNDLAFYTVNGVSTQLASASQLSAAQLNNGSASPNFSFQTSGSAGNGYTGVNITVPTTGNYTFGFGVSDVTTNTVYSGLLIDNLNYSVVPEPGTDALLALGVGGTCMAAFSRRRLRDNG